VTRQALSTDPDTPDIRRRFRNAIVALAGDPGEPVLRGRMAGMLEFGPAAQELFDEIVTELLEDGAIDRRAAIMMRALAARVRQLGEVEDPTMLLDALGADVGAEATRVWSETEPGDESGPETRGPKTPGEGDLLDDRYQLDSLIGIGGMAVVFRAVDLTTGDRVATKILKDSLLSVPGVVEAFEREAKRARQISHPNVVRILGAGRHQGIPYMAMEYLNGTPLARTLKSREGEPTPWKEVRSFLTEIGGALEAAHKLDIVHCDVKPSNIFRLTDGRWMLLDFGIAQSVRPTRTGGGLRSEPVDPPPVDALTPAYASREQLLRLPPDRRDDIFSLSVIAYQMLTGFHPYDRVPADKAASQRMSPPRPKKLPGRAWRVLRQGLAFDRKGRPKTMARFLKGLRRGMPLWPWILLVLVLGAVGAVQRYPDQAEMVATQGRLIGAVGQGLISDRPRDLIDATVALKKADGATVDPLIELLAAPLGDRFGALTEVDDKTPLPALRQAARFVADARSLLPDDPRLAQWAERPFHLLVLDLSDRLGADAPLDVPLFVDDVRLLAKVDPDGFAAVEDVLIDSMFVRMKDLKNERELRDLTEAGRTLFPSVQWPEPVLRQN